MKDDKTVMELIDEIYRNYDFTVGECVSDMLTNGRITIDDLKKDHSLKKLDWLSVEQCATSREVEEIAEQKVSS